jgi:hypothetical protein
MDWRMLRSPQLPGSYPAVSHRGKHFDVKPSRPAKEDETKKRGEGDRNGREGGVRDRIARWHAGFLMEIQ